MSDPATRAAWVARVLGVSVPAATASPALAAWRAARAAAIATLRALESAIRAMEVPQRDPAIILVRAIAANLTESPVTPAQQAALRRYLETDDIIAEAEDPNGFGITVRLRAPLLAALAGLEGQGAPR